MHGLLDDGLCDEREMPCTDAHFFAYPLIDSPNLTCHLTEFFVSFISYEILMYEYIAQLFVIVIFIYTLFKEGCTISYRASLLYGPL